MIRTLRRYKYTLTGAAFLLVMPLFLGLAFWIAANLVRSLLVPSLLPVGYWQAVLWAGVLWAVPAGGLVVSFVLSVRKGRR